MDKAATESFVGRTWDQSIVPALTEYIRIPNQSPLFDSEWVAHGHMARAVKLVADWCRANGPRGLKLEVAELPGRTPLIFMEVPGSGPETVLLYGHLDKQPPMLPWEQGLDPWTPVLRDGKLYGRGGADDGYAAFASLTAIRALQEQGLPHARCVILIEACEESGSGDLPAHIEALAPRIGTPSFIVCLDSGCGNYEQLWCTTSLRGIAGGVLEVRTLSEGVHSGDASGIVPSTVRILRQLLARLEDGATGRVLLPELWVDIPVQRVAQAQLAARELGADIGGKFPFLKGVQPVGTDPVELVLNRTWRPALAVTGQAGMPPLENAGNVMRPATAVKLSMRLPPTCDAARATARMKQVLESDAPYGAHVSFSAETASPGWHAPESARWLEESLESSSRTFFGQPACQMGEGGSIPFMAMLGQRFPKAQFMITGVLGPKSNAHGPNEFLHLATGRRLTCCVAQAVSDHHRAFSENGGAGPDSGGARAADRDAGAGSHGKGRG
ncbi:MAG TPA: M20 family metallopeptidase [Planctomycetota bacterium]|nr:M20 family metallopeptidase [Planctomycetota bacterium]